MFNKVEIDLCNESWFEMEIASIQTQMAAYDYDSDEYQKLMERMLYLSEQVLRIEDTKTARAHVLKDLISKAVELGEVVIFSGVAITILRRLIK